MIISVKLLAKYVIIIYAIRLRAIYVRRVN